jgi:hypothetical protein
MIDYEAGQTFYWEPGHNLEAVIDVEYVEIIWIEDYDALMTHCRAQC